MDNGTQIWRVPQSESYVIEAWGASGAQVRESQGVLAATIPGGKGAYMMGTFNFTRGTLLKILVRQAGSTGTVGSPLVGGDGGGGTFIISSSNATLIVAGGEGVEAMQNQEINTMGSGTDHRRGVSLQAGVKWDRGSYSRVWFPLNDI